MKLVPWDQVKDILNVAEDILESVEDELTVRSTHVPQPYTQEHLRAFLATPPAGVKRWAIIVDDRYAGNVELRHRSGHVADLGYTAAPWAHESGIHRVELRAAVHNHASRRVAERAGFTLEGICRDGELLRGEYNDLAVYSRLSLNTKNRAHPNE